MDFAVSNEKRFASFLLDGERAIEFAIRAEDVLEATPITGAIQPLPASVPYLEGLMHLRDDAIFVINMKKRLGMAPGDYGDDAKVAVVAVHQLRLGLLFDDIKDVLMVDREAIDPIHPAFQAGEGFVSDLIRLDHGRRTMELLDLQRLLGDGKAFQAIHDAENRSDSPESAARKTYSRFVVFSSLGQDYGMPVEQVQEITFLSKIDDVFQNDSIEGAVQLRGRTIPVLSATRMLRTRDTAGETDENTRVLILDAEGLRCGMIVDSVREIISIPDETVMALPRSGHNAVHGIHQRPDGSNIMLLQADTLIGSRAREFRSIARLKSSRGTERTAAGDPQARHLITADCYLVFSIGRNFAIELNDVQEIIETRDLMTLPASTGFDRRVLNLRGSVIPVIDLQAFYGYADEEPPEEKKLIVARSRGRVVALEVDRILTIHKQVQYKLTPSLNPQLSDKKDTLDRLIEFVNESGLREHVLVINIAAMRPIIWA
jgi:purine-binding chemotaxis protein CheW